MAVVLPSEDTSVGVLGRGYLSVLTAKLSALEGYSTWIVVPPGEEETIRELMFSDDDEKLENLVIVSGADSDMIESKMADADALVVVVDDDSTMDEGVLKYLINPMVNEKKLKRVVAMSRNLNGKDMGFFVTASKKTAFQGVWDLNTKKSYLQMEDTIKKQVELCAASSGLTEYTFVRAGTLKGGACGDDEYKQYLTSKYYEMTKKDLITWQLLFDCNVRGVKFAKGDVLPGPGSKAVFTATSSEECAGDTSRCGIAEAMVKSLQYEQCGNMDFGVATVQSREPPTESEWVDLFDSLK